MLQSSRIIARRCFSGVVGHSRSGLSTVAATPAPIITSDVISDDVAELIEVSGVKCCNRIDCIHHCSYSHYHSHSQKYTKKKQTSASLDTLLRTGRGELLGKGDELSILSEHMPTDDRIRMQVASFLRKDLPIRLAHRILDLDQVPMMRDMDSVQGGQEYLHRFLSSACSVPQDSNSGRRAQVCHLVGRLVHQTL